MLFRSVQRAADDVDALQGVNGLAVLATLQVNVVQTVLTIEPIRKKPAPDTVYAALKELGVDKDGAVYVGDSDVDIATARNSGLPCISVLWGFRDREFLIEHGGETFISKPQDLL